MLEEDGSANPSPALNPTAIEPPDQDELERPAMGSMGSMVGMGIDFGPADVSSWKTASFGSFKPPGIGDGEPPPGGTGGEGEFPFAPFPAAGMPSFFGGSAAELEAQAAELDFRAIQLKQAALQAEMAAHQARTGLPAMPSMAGMGANGFGSVWPDPSMMGYPSYMGGNMMPDQNWMGPNMNMHMMGGGKGQKGQGNARPKKASGDSSKAAKSASSSCSAPGSQTTIMLRNIPNNYNREMVLELLDTEGFKGDYDFVYLPMDFHRMAGLGYAFVNLVTPDAAQRVKRHFEGFSGWKLASLKICEVSWGEPLQGLEAHIERYRNSPVMHEDVPDKYKPVLYTNGERIQFPTATKKIRPPRVKKSSGPPAASKGEQVPQGDTGDGSAGSKLVRAPNNWIHLADTTGLGPPASSALGTTYGSRTRPLGEARQRESVESATSAHQGAGAAEGKA